MAIIIIMAIIGGYGSFMGPILGATVIEFLTEYLRVYGEIRMVLYGLIVLITMRVFREGLWGVIQSIYRKLKTSSKGQSGVERD